jgi:hypothetical protein
MTWLDVAREVFPGKPDEYLDYVLWEHTGFPAFWRTDDPIAECRSQMERYRDFGAACYRCGAYGTANKHGKPYVRYRAGIPFCAPCVKKMDAECAAQDRPVDLGPAQESNLNPHPSGSRGDHHE